MTSQLVQACHATDITDVPLATPAHRCHAPRGSPGGQARVRAGGRPGRDPDRHTVVAARLSKDLAAHYCLCRACPKADLASS